MPNVDRACVKSGKALVRGGRLVSCCCCDECLPACCKPDGTCEPMLVGECIGIGGAPGVRWGLGGNIVFAYACCSESEECRDQLNPNGVVLYNNGVSCEAICADDECCPQPQTNCSNVDSSAGNPDYQPHVCCICDGWPVMPDVIDIIFPAVTAVPCPVTWVGPPCSAVNAAPCCTDICNLNRQAMASLLAGGLSLSRVHDAQHMLFGNPCVFSGTVCTSAGGYTCPGYPATPGFPTPLSCGPWQVCLQVTLTFARTAQGNLLVSIGILGSSGACGVCNCPANIDPNDVVHTVVGSTNCGVFEYDWSPGSSFLKVDPNEKLRLML